MVPAAISQPKASAVAASLRRISGILLRYVYLHKRSVSRALELVFWPVMEMVVWGFVMVYVRSLASEGSGDFIVFLLGGVIFWDILYRSQQAVTISFIEDIWTQNIMNLFISPLRLPEWLAATFIYGFLKTMLITAILSALAVIGYRFNLVAAMDLYMAPMVLNLLFFGWALGVFTSGLLIRWGHAVEALIWGIPFLVQPISAIYYPLSTLPAWLQVVSRAVPSTYVFEGMRSVLKDGTFPVEYFFISLGLNLLFFFAASLFFMGMIHSARVSGRLGRLGMD